MFFSLRKDLEMSKYETSLSGVSTSISYVVNNVKAGTLLDSKKESAYHLWNLQGYAQGLVLGLPAGQEQLSGDSAIDMNKKLSSLSVLEPLANDEATFGAEAKAVNVIQIIGLAKMVFDLLKQLGVFDKKDNEPIASDESHSSNPAG